MKKRLKTAPAEEPPPATEAEALEQLHAHSSSYVIDRQRALLVFELSTVDDALVRLKDEMQRAKSERERIKANIAALDRVLARR